VRRKGESELLVSGYTRHASVSTVDFKPCQPPQSFLDMMG